MAFLTWRRLVPGASLMMALAPMAARAQTPSPLAEWQYSAGIPLERLFHQSPDWQAEVGVGAALQPQYDGAGRYQVQAGPSIDLRYHSTFFASTGEGVGANILSGTHYRVGVAVTYDLGRRVASDYNHLYGLGNISPAPEGKVFAEYSISQGFPLVLRVDVRRALGGSEGLVGDFGAYLPMPGSNADFAWFAGPSVTLADATYMNSYFGVGRAQAARSGLPRYHADAGLKSAGVGVSADWFLADHWILNASGSFARLLDSAQASPITQAASEAFVSVSVIYKF